MKYIILVLLFFTGCATTTQPAQEVISPVSRLFHADYNTTWRALMLALEKYPIEEEDQEKGYLKTAIIKGESIWQLPFHSKTLPRLKYTIHVQLIKGTRKNKSIVQVSVLKQLTSQKGFIDSPQRIPSNGLEEKTILYRILREMNIDRAITKYHHQQSQPKKR